MKHKIISRDQAIDALVALAIENDDSEQDMVDTILRRGFMGFDNEPNERLTERYRDCFNDPDITVRS